MIRRVFSALAVSMLLTGAAAGQQDYLDVFVVRVKPEKRADFDAVSKKIADANRRNKGDTWVAMETMYGEGNVVTFVSTRHGYAEVEKGYEAFLGALNKAYGPAGAAKLLQDENNCTLSSRSEVRRRRWDLSANAPQDAAAMAKLVGETRYIRTVMVHVRPGRVLDVEAQIKDVKAAWEKANPQSSLFVSLADAGQHGTVFYVSRLRSSLASFDADVPLPQAMGEEGYRKFLSASAESLQGTDTVINHFLPELSNPPEEVVAASPDFWRPKPQPAAKPKAAQADKPAGKEK